MDFGSIHENTCKYMKAVSDSFKATFRHLTHITGGPVPCSDHVLVFTT